MKSEEFPPTMLTERLKSWLELSQGGIATLILQDWDEQNAYWIREVYHQENYSHLSQIPKSKASTSNPWVNDFSSRILDKFEGSDDLLKKRMLTFNHLKLM